MIPSYKINSLNFSVTKWMRTLSSDSAKERNALLFPKPLRFGGYILLPQNLLCVWFLLIYHTIGFGLYINAGGTLKVSTQGSNN